MPPKPSAKQYGALVFDFGTLTAGSGGAVKVKNNRTTPLVLTDIGACCSNGANSHLDFTLQMRDQATGQEWFSAAAPIPALVGPGLTSGILATDQTSAPQQPVKLAAPYVLMPGAELQATATNYGGSNAPLVLVLSGFYAAEGA